MSWTHNITARRGLEQGEAQHPPNLAAGIITFERPV
jgi:hypothetical protein